MVTDLKSKEVCCRKSHRCAWCDEVINAGERAHCRVYIFDGFTTDYMHLECYEAMGNYPDMRDLEDGWMAGDFKRGSTEPSW